MTVSRLLCLAPNDLQYKAQTGQVLSSLVQLSGAPVNDVVGFIRARLDSATWEKERTATCSAVAARAEAGKRETTFATALGQAFGCGRTGVPDWWSRGST